MADELEPFRGGVEKKGDGKDLEPRRFTTRQLVGGGLVAVVVVLVLQNTNNANVHLLLFTAAYPMWLVLGGVTIVSFMAGWLFGRARGARRRGR
jgi:uncharacterized integral membrane protein